MAEVQNDGLDEITLLQYWHTWVRAMAVLICCTGWVARNPVFVLSPPDGKGRRKGPLEGCDGKGSSGLVIAVE